MSLIQLRTLRWFGLFSNSALIAAATVGHDPFVFGSGLVMLVTQEMGLFSLRRKKISSAV